ncbi:MULTISPECIES: alginate O-acetyltransferase [Pseudomonas]|uniref:alginate O-acetyltransferase n=1 Tax=Pseudomonas TaxID=286 RepID=UPI0002A2CE8B|nr:MULTISPECIES: alginate O-acetyltransferase [Pseudomonas]AMO78463.1 Alginate biosynthesis protein AlgX precursor [Pseudomonas citronellolis]NTX92445.1 alginate O-acetyltransferase [Pseudomonas sp. UMA643]NTY21547.1 alginate O-acetyltransferase [Pseudomonas sp. UMC3103]NTY28533.1 alginate O-acetyltransferase [Pseudomonas sp. UMA603]NTY34606.1 alginate O-acetyltransferase [Pseudomonas sp. UMC3129]
MQPTPYVSKISKPLQYAYVAAFGGILLGLAGWSLKAFPSFAAAEGTTVLNGKLAHAFEGHYDDQFPIKRLGTNLWAALDYALFDEGRPGVVIGKDGWLYTDEEFKPAPSQTQLDDNWALVRGVQQELERRGVKLVLAIIPAKARIYPEYIGKEQPAQLHVGLYDEFLQRARQAGMAAPKLLDTLEQAKNNGQVFLRTDTHWTPLGAEAVAQRLAQSIREGQNLDLPQQTFITDASKATPHKGDLLTFLPLDPLFSELLPAPDQLQARQTHPAEDNAAAGGDLFGDSAEPQVALVGTSYSANPHWNFAGALKQALSTDLINYAKEGKGPLEPMLELLKDPGFQQKPPRLLVWEFPERYLPMHSDLSQFDADWLAQLRAAGNRDERLAANPPGLTAAH